MKSFVAITYNDQFWGEVHNVARYFDHLSATQWGILSAAAVSFGIFLLRGTALRP